MKKHESSNIIQSLERGLTALETIINNGSGKPSDIAEELGVDRSTAYRLLFTLTKKGFLIQDPLSHNFLPNPVKLFAFIGEMGEPADWPLRAAEFLRQLRDRTGETSNLGALTENEVVYLAQVRTLDALTVSNPIGSRRPWHCSALGKAILAYLPESELNDRMEGKPLLGLTFRTITDLQTLLRHLTSVRENGYAIDDEENYLGVRCIAAPVFDHSRQVIASIGISGPSTRLTLERLPELIPIIVDVASQASVFFGAPKPTTKKFKAINHFTEKTQNSQSVLAGAIINPLEITDSSDNHQNDTGSMHSD